MLIHDRIQGIDMKSIKRIIAIIKAKWYLRKANKLLDEIEKIIEAKLKEKEQNE